jgi:hypothetical protein
MSSFTKLSAADCVFGVWFKSRGTRSAICCSDFGLVNDQLMGIRMTVPAVDTDYSWIGELATSNEHAPRLGPGGGRGPVSLPFVTTIRPKSMPSSVAFTSDRYRIAAPRVYTGNGAPGDGSVLRTAVELRVPSSRVRSTCSCSSASAQAWRSAAQRPEMRVFPDSASIPLPISR